MPGGSPFPSHNTRISVDLGGDSMVSMPHETYTLYVPKATIPQDRASRKGMARTISTSKDLTTRSTSCAEGNYTSGPGEPEGYSRDKTG